MIPSIDYLNSQLSVNTYERNEDPQGLCYRILKAEK
jgi:hypothetical protein